MANQCVVPSVSQPVLSGENPLIDMNAGAGLRKGRHAHDSLSYVQQQTTTITTNLFCTLN